MHQRVKVAAAFVAGSLLAGGGAIAATSSNDVTACVNTKTRVMTLAPASGKCASGTSKLSWSVQGPQGATGATGPAGASGGGSSLDVSAIARRLLPSVVTIQVESADGGGTGSGFITAFSSRANDGNSYVITNNHVVEGATSIIVELDDGTELPGQLVGTDPTYDIAVVLVQQAGLPTVALSTSASPTVGAPVIAFGSPLGLNGTVTSGIVSGLNRPVTTSGTSTDSFINAIQTDAAINPGNSGGPLVDVDGSVIGINSAIATLDTSGNQTGSIGLGFSIPIHQAYRIANELVTTANIANGRVAATGRSTRPLLGVTFTDPQSGTGATVVSVTPGGAAAAAGIPVGAVVHKIGARVVKDMLTAIVTIAAYDPGATVTIVADLPNGGGSKTFTVTLGSRQSN